MSWRLIKSPRPLGATFAPAVAAVWLAGAAHADPPAAPAAIASPSGAPAGALPLPPDLWSLPDPIPASAQAPIDRLFRAEEGPEESGAQAAPSGAGATSPWQSPNLLGDMGGLRSILGKAGMSLSILENAETFGNLTGGVRQGFTVNGLTTVTLQLDTKQAFGLDGGLFNVSGLHIWGGALSLSNLLNFQTVSDIEATPSVRLWELWYQQKFGDRLDIKIGEQSVDQEFMVTPDADVFLNAMMGWAVLPSADLPAGGPAYPLAGLGVRGRAQVTDAVTVLAGVFNGNPVPPNLPSTETSNPNGVSFPLNTGVFAIAELQYALGGSPTKPGGSGPLPGTYRIGAWYDSESFNNEQYNNIGVPLASPLSNGIPAKRPGDYSIYVIADQMVWRSGDPNRSVSIFLRPMFTTLQDRNLISFSADAGVTLHKPLAGRDNDVLGLGIGVARVSNGVVGYDRNREFYDPAVFTPVRGAETVIEATYQAQITPSWQLQPDVQYVINPAGGIPNPNAPTQRIRNELVIGLRTNITF